MSTERDKFEEIARAISQALTPLKKHFQDAQAFRNFMYRLGWNVNSIPNDFLAAVTSVTDLISEFESLPQNPQISDIQSLVDKCSDVFQALDNITSIPSGVDVADQSSFQNNLIQDIFDILINDYLEFYSKGLYAFLESIGIIWSEYIPATLTRPAFTKRHFSFSRAKEFISHPSEMLNAAYDWGGAQFASRFLIKKLANLFHGLGFIISAGDSPEENKVFEESVAGVDTRIKDSLRIFFFFGEILNAPMYAGVEIFNKPSNGNQREGLTIKPFIPSSITTQLPISEFSTFEVRVGSNLNDLFGIDIYPDGLDVRYPFQQGTALPQLGFGVNFSYSPASQILLLGRPNTSRVTMDGINIRTRIDHLASDFEIEAEIELTGLSIILDGQQGDGFINRLLGGATKKIDFPLSIIWNNQTGISFKGAGGFEIETHPHFTIGPLSIPDIRISIATPSSGGQSPMFNFAVAANIKADLGPVKVLTEEIGVDLQIDSTPGGNLGFMGVKLGFKPPIGIGISIDTEAVKGGGYLYFDHINQKYAGVAELTIKEKISVKAIGLLTTKLPDGTPKVSFLLLITAEFSPINLGFGFTLNGVGGLVGINRTMLLDELRKGVKDNTLDHILFPSDPVANAAQIISDIDRVFPVDENRYVFGLMGILGWGTPNLITAEIGLMIEVPDPVKIAILGVVKCVMPDEDKSLLSLQVNFLGTIDFEKKLITFDASLFDSRLLNFTLNGDMALRVKWGENPNFLFTIGGFHPRYTPPPLALPTLNRLTINLLNGDNPRLTLSNYFAITSNTVQVGARVDFFMRLTENISILGYMGFDALFQFNPFYFDVSFEAGLAVKKNDKVLLGIDLRLRLQGTSPWHVEGKAEFNILITFTINIDKTWGDNVTTTLPGVEVSPLLVAAIVNPANWKVDESVTGTQLITFRKFAPSNSTNVLIDPERKFGFSQKVVPLGVAIGKFGNQIPIGAKKFTAEILQGPNSLATTDNQEDFAPASFFPMADDQKLSRPSFEKYNSGLTVKGSEKQKSDFWREVELKYETIVMDTRYQPLPFSGVQVIEDERRFNAYIRNNAAAKSRLGTKVKAKSILAPNEVKTRKEGFAIVGLDDRLIFNNMTAGSIAEAHDILTDLYESDPALERKLQVVSMYELA